MENINIYTDYITLGQFLKLSGTIRNGGEAKAYLNANFALVNGETEQRRGRKLYDGFVVEVNNCKYLIKKDVCSE